MAERISGAALTLAFNKRANSELGVLHEKLEVQLRDDLKKEIYSENTVTDKENDLVAYLSKLKKVSCHSIDPCTPESDVYLTPETSPTDIRHRYGHTRCASDSGLDNLANQPIDLRKTNALYYSLVTVDEVYDSYTNEADAILEKELAEQDELFKSFKSIISKEGQTSNTNKGNKPSTFKLPFSPKHKIIFPRGQNKLLNKTACLDFKFDLNRTIKERYSQKKCVTNVCKIDGTASENVVEIVKHSTNVNNLRSFNSTDVGNSASVYETQCSLSNNKEKHIKQLENMSKLHKIEVDEVMSNTEIDTQGQDSCLEAGSSGYLTGSSPKETVSETSAADVTEVATSDDIPHDNDKSVQSSSVSSDEGTWESTFPNSNAADGIQATSSIIDEKCTDDIKLSPCNDIYNKEVKNFGNGFFSDNKQFEVHNLPSVRDQSVKTETSDILRNNNLTSNCYKGLVRSCKDGSFLDNSNECENGHHTTVKTEITYEPESYIDYSNKEEELQPSNRHDVFDRADLDSNNCSHKTNCFIDASSLSDESEILVPTPRLSNIDNGYFDIYDTSVSNNITDKSKQTANFVIEEKEISPLSIDENLCNRQDNSNHSNSGFAEKTIPKESSSFPPTEKNEVPQSVNIESTQADFEKRRSSLIRRNTFELEPNDEKLAMLRHEFEKRQGNLMSQSSKQSELNGEYDIGVSYEESSYKQGPPNSLSIQNNLPVHQVLDDEAHSPDSLNNDGIIDSFTDRMDKKMNCHGSIEDKRVISTDFLTGVIDSQNRKGSDKDICLGYLNYHSTLDQSNANLNESTKKFNKANILSQENNIESMPIISVGVSANDFPIGNEVPISPLNRRKAENVPIVSGGSVELPAVEPEPKPKINSSLTTSWIVDMSDTIKSPPEGRKKKRSNSVLSSASSDHCEYDDGMSKSTSRMSSSALGFFIPLDDTFDEKSSSESGYKSLTPQMQRNIKAKDTAPTLNSESAKMNSESNCVSSCGFFVDLKEDKKIPKKVNDLPTSDNKLFTMFIDVSEPGSLKSLENISPKTKISSPHFSSKKNRLNKSVTERFASKHLNASLSSEEHQSLESNTDISEHPEVSKGKLLFSGTPPPSRQISHTDESTSDLTDSGSKKSFYMFIEADSSPVPRRRTLPSGLRPNIQRHSWNPDSVMVSKLNDTQQTELPKKHHRRAHSVSVDKSLEIMFTDPNIEKKKYSTSSLVKISDSNSIGYESGPSSIDEHIPRTFDKNSKLMIASWHGSIKPSTELQKVIARSERRDFKDSKSSIFSRSHENKSLENGFEDKLDDTVDKFDETGCVSMKSDETFDLSNVSEVSSYRDNQHSTFVLDVSNVATATSNDLELSTPSHDFFSELSKDDSDTTETGFNNKEQINPKILKMESKSNLSEKDTPATPDHSISQPLISVPEEVKSSFVKLSDMDKEPARFVFEEKRIVNRMSRSIPEASWIESKLMTRSATSRSLSRLFPHLQSVTRNRTPESADQDTDISEISSLQSSMEPSALEGSTEETDASSCTSGPCSRLGEDLLRMFLDEISPDVTVEVGGRRIKAHKCILSSRCQYFAAILSGGWVESAGNVISLQGFSYSAVHFALCHIYSGTSNIPDSINIVELATLADMLCLEGLKEIIMYTLKAKYCHFFHKPCPMCTVGVLECLPLAAAYGLDEIYRKSLRWITKYFVRVWPTKGFATLPKELLEKCYKQHVVHMSVDNVLETVLCCGKLQATIPAVRWAEPVISLTTKLYEAAIKYIAQHFCGILSNEMFLALGKEDLWSVSRLEDTLNAAADKLPPDQACKCHSKLYNIINIVDGPDPPPEMQWSRAFVELLRRLSIVVENGLIRQAARAARTPAWCLMEPHLRHKIQDAACLVIVPGDERRRARHSSLLRRSEGVNRSNDIQQVKAAITQQTAAGPKKSSSVVATAAVTSKPKSVATKNEETGPRPKTWPHKLSEVKSRYLEQKPVVKAQPNVKERVGGSVPVTRRTISKSIISSSDSSRTSSPAMKPLTTRPSRSLPSKESNLRQKCDDGISMSTDSLAESTMTKPSISGNKALTMKKTNTEVKTPLLNRTRRILPNKIDGIKTKSTESLSKAKTTGLQSALNKDTNKAKSSPLPLNKKSSCQNSPIVGNRFKTPVNSTPSPSLKRTTSSVKNTPEVKSSSLTKRTTYRVQAKPLANQNKATPPKSTTSNQKNYINHRVQNKLNVQTENMSTNNNPPPGINDNKTETKLRPMVGSRSGTFLKDEPTILKKPQVTNVNE